MQPSVVEKREVERRKGIELLPHSDDGFMELFVKRGGSGLRMISAAGIFSLLQDTTVPTSFEDLSRSVARHVQKVADLHKVDKAVKQRFSRGAGKPTASLVLDELIRTFLIDGKSSFDEHDAIDLMHATVPNAFCDFLVLDGEWKHRSEVIRPRLRSATGGPPPARVFSTKRIDIVTDRRNGAGDDRRNGATNLAGWRTSRRVKDEFLWRCWQPARGRSSESASAPGRTRRPGPGSRRCVVAGRG
jgi:hypothetical protein